MKSWQKRNKNQPLLFGVALLLLLFIIWQGRETSKKTTKNWFEGLNVKESQEDEATYIRSQMSTCFRAPIPKNSTCYKDVARLFLSQFSLSQVLKTFRENESYPEIYSHCHAVTHFLARREYQKTRNIPKVYEQCDATCHGGCYHGALEGYFQAKNVTLTDWDDKFLRGESSKLCGQSEDYQKVAVYGECVHGIGHAMMFVTEADVPRSLGICDVLPSVQEREACYGGVFMENSSSSTNLDHPAKFVKSDDLLYPCNILGKQYSRSCYTYQSSYYLTITGKVDWPKNVELCGQIPQAYQEYCFRTVGTNIVGSFQNIPNMYATCQLIKTAKFVNVCVQGVVVSLGGRYGGDAQRIIQFCAFVDNFHKEICYKQMGSSISSWVSSPSEWQNICRGLPEKKYETWCLGAKVN